MPWQSYAQRSRLQQSPSGRARFMAEGSIGVGREWFLGDVHSGPIQVEQYNRTSIMQGFYWSNIGQLLGLLYEC